jgi:hypothetical protein
LEWQRLGAIAPGALAPAREALHHAVQLVAAAGETFVAHRADTSHTALVWLEGHAALAGQELAGRWPCRLAVRVRDLTLLVVDRQGAPHAELLLEERSPAEAASWAVDALRDYTHGEHVHALVHPGFEIPGRVARFAAPADALAELARWYANAELELQALALRTPGSGPVLCWPHHFDLATLVSLAPPRTIGVGLSPGDAGIPEPYLYVTHSPPQTARALPPLDAGEWNTAGWLGAALRGGALAAAGDARAQQSLWRHFVASAVCASGSLFGA